MMIIRNCFVKVMIIGISVCMGSTPAFYYSEKKTRRWNEAKDDCESRGMELAMLDTNQKRAAAKSYIKSRQNKDDIWIGLSLDRSVSYPPYVYRYINGFAPTYLPWGYSHEPDDQSTDFCVRMQISVNFGFLTKACSAKFTYLCTSIPESPTTQPSVTTIVTDRSTLQTDSTTVTEYITSTKQSDTTSVTEYTRSTEPTDTTTETEYVESTETTDSTLVTGYPTSSQQTDSTTKQADTTVVTRYEGSTQHTYTTASHEYDDQFGCLCPCTRYTNRWHHLLHSNYTMDELKEIMKTELNEIMKKLKVDITVTSSYVRSKTSASDSRVSSRTVGTVGIAILTFVAILCVLLDCTHLVKAIFKSFSER